MATPLGRQRAQVPIVDALAQERQLVHLVAQHPGQGHRRDVVQPDRTPRVRCRPPAGRRARDVATLGATRRAFSVRAASLPRRPETARSSSTPDEPARAGEPVPHQKEQHDWSVLDQSLGPQPVAHLIQFDGGGPTGTPGGSSPDSRGPCGCGVFPAPGEYPPGRHPAGGPRTPSRPPARSSRRPGRTPASAAPTAAAPSPGSSRRRRRQISTKSASLRVKNDPAPPRPARPGTRQLLAPRVRQEAKLHPPNLYDHDGGDARPKPRTVLTPVLGR
jgi:hypothetical protein